MYGFCIGMGYTEEKLSKFDRAKIEVKTEKLDFEGKKLILS